MRVSRKCSYNFSQKIGYRNLILFVYVGKVEIPEKMQNEVSMTIYMGRMTIQRKIQK